jgi:hypothetical protein
MMGLAGGVLSLSLFIDLVLLADGLSTTFQQRPGGKFRPRMASRLDSQSAKPEVPEEDHIGSIESNKRARCLCFGTVALAALLLLSTQQVTAQALYGSIIGNVTDPTQAAVPDATVTVIETKHRPEPDCNHQQRRGLQLPYGAERHL